MNKLKTILRSLNFLSAPTPTINATNDEIDECSPLLEESLTAVSSSHRAVLTALKHTKAKAREKFLSELASSSPEDKAIMAYVFRQAFDEELNILASQEWKLLSIAEQGTIQQAVRAAVFEIEGSKGVRTPLSSFSLKMAGLPQSSKEWDTERKRTYAQLDVLATSRPIPGVTRVIARAVYPLLHKEPKHVFLYVHTPPWQIPETRKGLLDVTLGYAEAFECWVEDHQSAKLNPLTREQLFTAINAVLRDIKCTNTDLACVIARRLFDKYKFTLEEVVSTASFRPELTSGWIMYPFGAQALGVLNLPVHESYHGDTNVCRDWTIGFLSRYKGTAQNLSEKERQEPFKAFNLQVQKALALKDPVDRYISLNQTIDRFSGVESVDPVDPQAGPKSVVATLPQENKPSLPSYKEVVSWREKNLQDYSSPLV